MRWPHPVRSSIMYCPLCDQQRVTYIDHQDSTDDKVRCCTTCSYVLERFGPDDGKRL